MAFRQQPYQPQLPRPVAVVRGSTWADIWKGIATLSQQNQNLVQYLQNWLTNFFKWSVPFKYAVVLVPAAQSPYQALLPPNSSEVAFIAMESGELDLPGATGSGRVIIVKKTDATPNPVAVTPNGTDTIDGGGVAAVVNQYDALRLIDAALGQWFIW